MARAAGDDLSAPAIHLAEQIGARIRERRKTLGLTLAKTAASAEISVSYLSSVEMGRNAASLPILARVAAALGLSIHDLLQDIGGGNAIRSSRIDVDTVGSQVVSHEDLQLQIARLVCEPGASGPSPLAPDGNEVFVYVAAGSLEITVDGETHVLWVGDSLDAEEPASVSWRNVSDERALSIWALGPPTGAGA